jgi:hypothetical protein
MNQVFKMTKIQKTQELKLIKFWQRSLDHQKAGQMAAYISRNEIFGENCRL